MKPEVVFELDTAAWPAIVVEPAGTIRYANQAAIDFFGPTLEGEGPSLSAIWSAENELPAEQFLARWDRSAKPSTVLKFVGRGSNAVAYSTMICSLNKEGQKRYLFQLVREKGAGETRTIVEDANLAQKQKLDCAVQLTRTVALDFNNALTSILGHTSLVLSRLPRDTPWRGSLIEVEKAAEKAAEIAQHLASFSRQEREPHERVAGNVNEIVRQTVEFFQNGKAAKTFWSLDLEPRLCSSRFEEAKLQQAVICVLENATEGAGESGQITVQTRNVETARTMQLGTAQLPAGNYVCIRISDNGPGIAAEILPRIFEPFFTTKQNHRGLGLALVYGIITNHAGGVAVESTPGAGVTVQIYLPALTAIAKEKAFRGQELSGQGTVLIVDDENLLLTMSESVLSTYGYRVLTANSAKHALEIISSCKAPIDLIITDLVMPQMSGREFTERLRALVPGTPVVSMSGYVRTGNEGQDTAYLQKPFTSQQLLGKVKRALSKNTPE